MRTSSELAPPPADPQNPQSAGKVLKWHRGVLGICFAIFAMEVGLFLTVFPWLASWDVNWVPLQSAQMRSLWMNHYLRGALSGIGLVNLYVGVTELGRHLRRLMRWGS